MTTNNGREKGGAPTQETATGQAKPTRPGPKFPLGLTVIARQAHEVLHPGDVYLALGRHQRGHWGDVGREDWEENELSLREGFRLLSAYRDRHGIKFWIITEWDRSITTVLLPEEY
ncbi:MAG: hypothetical protein L0Z62_23080 [Gemmataceae bacterium]|nr:hypothetical protein [Gemmataceae bacterium]